jgi:uncharacterized RDD family membrane protein YckC
MAMTHEIPQVPGQQARTPTLRYASFESRVVAGTLDVLVLLIVASLLISVGSIVILISSDFEKTQASGTAINVFWACVVAIPPSFALYLFISLAWRGQTAGAAVMQVTVLRSDGRGLGVFGSLARLISMLVYLLIVGLGAMVAFAFRDSLPIAVLAITTALLLAVAGVLWSAFDPRRRTLHDRIAGTIVVRLE